MSLKDLEKKTKWIITKKKGAKSSDGKIKIISMGRLKTGKERLALYIPASSDVNAFLSMVDKVLVEAGIIEDTGEILLKLTATDSPEGYTVTKQKTGGITISIMRIANKLGLNRGTTEKEHEIDIKNKTVYILFPNPNES